MTIKSLTIANTTSGLSLLGDGYTLTIAGANGITMSSSVPASTIGAKVALGASQTWTNNSANKLTVSGSVSGAFNLTSAGTGVTALTGANSYTGTTTVSGGTLQFAQTTSLYNNTTGNWTAAKILVGNGGTLAFNVGGTSEFSAANITTLLTNLGGSNGSSAGGLAAGSAIGFDTTNAAGSTFTVADTLADSTGTGGGAVGLAKLGTNTLILSAANTFTGPIAISGGTLQVGTGAASTGSLGSGTYAGNIVNNGILSFQTTANQILNGNISGTGQVIVNPGQGGSLTLGGSNSTYSGGTVFQGVAAKITSASALGTGMITFQGGGSLDSTVTAMSTNNAQNWSWDWNYLGATNSLNMGTGNVTLTSGATPNLTYVTVSANTLTVGGVISGAAGRGLGKDGAGTLTLNGNNTYTGATVISTGTLALGSSGSISSTSGVAVASGATFDVSGVSGGYTLGGLSAQILSGYGTVHGPITIGATGTVHPSAGAIGTMTFTSGLTATSGATFSFNINSTAISSDLLAITGTTNLGGASLVLNDIGANPSFTGSMTLLTSTSLTGQFLNQTEGSTITVGSNTYVISYLSNMVTLSISAVPEPSTTAALVGAMILGLAIYRRRRS